MSFSPRFQPDDTCTVGVNLWLQLETTANKLDKGTKKEEVEKEKECNKWDK